MDWRSSELQRRKEGCGGVDAVGEFNSLFEAIDVRATGVSRYGLGSDEGSCASAGEESSVSFSIESTDFDVSDSVNTSTEYEAVRLLSSPVTCSSVLVMCTVIPDRNSGRHFGSCE